MLRRTFILLMGGGLNSGGGGPLGLHQRDASVIKDRAGNIIHTRT